MICVVTAGPTHEPLDAVRRLTNFSTGRLGSRLADYLTQQNHEVFLLRSASAVYQSPSSARHVLQFGTAEELGIQLQGLAAESVNAVFHAAAVGDFRFGKIWTRGPESEMTEIKMGKISSRSGGLLAELLPTPKLIHELCRWFPRAWLVGWKYEVDGTAAAAVARARSQIQENQTHACVVNGPAYGDGYGLVDAAPDHRHAPNEAELFELLAAGLSLNR